MTQKNQVSISVIIPTFNARQYIVSAIDSAIAQTYEPYEIIVVDDGSTDGTGELVKSKFGKRVRYYHQKNRGVSAARNLGALEARGEWLAFLDSDDVWLPKKLEKQIGVLMENPACDVILSDACWVDSNGHEKGRVRKVVFSDRKPYLDQVIKYPTLLPSTLLLKRRKFVESGMFDEALKTAEDLDLHLRLATSCRFFVINEPLVSCLLRTSGLSGLKRTYHDYVFVIERFVSQHADLLTTRATKEALVLAHLLAVKGYTLHKDYWAALSALGRAMRHCRNLNNSFKVINMIVYCLKVISLTTIKGLSFLK